MEASAKISLMLGDHIAALSLRGTVNVHATITNQHLLMDQSDAKSANKDINDDLRQFFGCAIISGTPRCG